MTKDAESLASVVKHKLTDQVRAFIEMRLNSFGLKNASPYQILDQMIGPMATSLPASTEKRNLVSNLRTAKNALLRVALAGSDSEGLFGRPLASDEGSIKAIPQYLDTLKREIDRIAGDAGEYTVTTNTDHISTIEEREQEFADYKAAFNRAFSPQRVTGVGV